MKADEQYFNFPVQLLAGFLHDSHKCLSDLLHYHLYAHALNLEHFADDEPNEDETLMRASAKFYHVTLGSVTDALRNGRTLYDSIPTDSPKVGISRTMFWDFFNNDKTEFDKVCLLAHLAIRSILGKKPYCKMNNHFWLARMDGKTHTIKEMQELSTPLQKYANEYQTTKIKKELRNNWGLVTYSRYTRGFYVSYSLTLDQLIFEAEKRRKSTLEKQHKAKEAEALKQALEKLKTDTRP